MPTLIASYAVYSGGSNTNPLVTPSFTPSDGEVVIVKLATWDTGQPMGAVSGGGQTYTTRVTAAPGGFNCWCRIVTATVAGSPGSMTVTAAGTAANSRHSMVVERWSGRLAASPAVNSNVGGVTGAPAADIATVGDGSVVSWVSADDFIQDPTGRVYRLGAIEDGFFNGYPSGDPPMYFAYADAPTSGTYTMGMTAPAGQRWVLAGIEILKPAAAGVTVRPNAGSTARPNTGRTSRPFSGTTFRP
jgi:hypothetical protein